MTNPLSTLEALAKAATPDWQTVADFAYENGVHSIDCNYIAAISPERVLAMIDCIRAADAMSTSCRNAHLIHAYDAARAALDELK